MWREAPFWNISDVSPLLQSMCWLCLYPPGIGDDQHEILFQEFHTVRHHHLYMEFFFRDPIYSWLPGSIFCMFLCSMYVSTKFFLTALVSWIIVLYYTFSTNWCFLWAGKGLSYFVWRMKSMDWEEKDVVWNLCCLRVLCLCCDLRGVWWS